MRASSLFILATAFLSCTLAGLAAESAPVEGVASGTPDLRKVLDDWLSALPEAFWTISPQALWDQKQAGTLFVLDVRDPKEVAESGMIEGSVNIPLRLLARNLDRLPHKDQPIVVYCSAAHRGAVAMETLRLLGYGDVRNLARGFEAWKAARLPVVTVAGTAIDSPAAPRPQAATTAPSAQQKPAPKRESPTVLIPAGEFLMGINSDGDNGPAHTVRVSAFRMDRFEVTNAEYYEFCQATQRKLPQYWGMTEFRCGIEYPDHPVVGVTWHDAQAYAAWRGKRLPTEAEWEYAARGGLVGQDFPNGGSLSASLANYSSTGTVRVGSYPPNAYGLCDMSGNAWEWVSDAYDDAYYRTSPTENPQGPADSRFRVIRGGGWHSGPSCNKVHHRAALGPSWVDFAVGFRCVRDETPPSASGGK